MSESAIYALVRSGELKASKTAGEWRIVPVTKEHVFTVKNLAECLDCTPRYVVQMIQEGAIRALRIGGSWRIPMPEAVGLMRRRLINENAPYAA